MLGSAATGQLIYIIPLGSSSCPAPSQQAYSPKPFCHQEDDIQKDLQGSRTCVHAGLGSRQPVGRRSYEYSYECRVPNRAPSAATVHYSVLVRYSAPRPAARPRLSGHLSAILTLQPGTRMTWYDAAGHGPVPVQLAKVGGLHYIVHLLRLRYRIGAASST